MAQKIETKAEMVRAIQRLQRSGKRLSYSKIRVTDGPLLLKARKLFGTWRKAVTAAGIDYERVSLIHRWSKPEITKELKSLYVKRDFPDISTLRRKHPKLYDACCRHYGSGLAALTAAGIDYEELLNEHPYRWTRSQIIQEMKRRHQEGKTLCRADMLRKEPRMKRFCYATMHHFGNWTKALKAAGLDPGNIRNRDGLWPKERVLAGIRQRFKQGKFLNTDLMLREDLPLHAAGRRHFGTWKAAVEKAGIDYKHVRGGLLGWTKNRTRDALKERMQIKGFSQTHVRDHAPSLFRAAIHHFGSWEAAIKAARSKK